ncbi:MAG: WbqC family protein [Candidatus Woykebacteria bacterium]
MRYTGIQPQYFPRLHYFARILNTDIFMARDDVQYVKKHKYPDGRTDKSYQSHTPIKQSFGRHLLSVPVEDKFSPINKTSISYDPDWVADHLKTLQFAYGRSANFKKLFPELEQALTAKFKTIADINLATIVWGILHLLGEKEISIKKLTIGYVNNLLADQSIFRLKKISRASFSEAAREIEKLHPNEKIIALCKEVGATEDYCGGTGATAYMDETFYKESGIKIKVQDWKCDEYHQLFTKQQGFIPNLSIIDLLMNTSLKEAQNIIASND